MAWDDFNNKRILGTVPVDADGSAYFAVPADRFVYFQLLDDRGMMVQSMRSGTIVGPARRPAASAATRIGAASVPSVPVCSSATRPAQSLAALVRPRRNFSYLAEVQPVFDKHCVVCHDYGKQAGEKLNLAGDLGLLFNTSYVELRSKKYVHVPGAGPYQTLMPKSWGSHASRLAQVLLAGHGDPEIDAQVKLDPESFDRIVTWIDINAPYYPEYASAYRGNRYGRSPLDDTQLSELQRLTGSIEVNFTRPEFSPCLAKFTDPNDPARRETLAIIDAGQRNLAARPAPTCLVSGWWGRPRSSSRPSTTRCGRRRWRHARQSCAEKTPPDR